MTFSVIIPVYNVQNYLRPALDSLLVQEGEDMEFLLIDDGSTDGSPAILREYAQRDSRFRLFSGPNGGYGRAMNRGLDKARGEYIGILEPDDLYEPESLARVRPMLGSDVIKGNFTLFWDNPNREEIYPLKTDTLGPCTPESNPRLLVNNPSIWAGFYRRAFLEKQGIRFAETPGASFQDLPFFWETFLKAESLFVTGEPLYRYRQSNPASSVKRKNAPERILHLYKRILPLVEALPRDRRAALEPGITAKIAEDLFWNLDKNRLRDLPAYLGNCRRIIGGRRKDLSLIESGKVRLFARMLFFINP